MILKIEASQLDTKYSEEKIVAIEVDENNINHPDGFSLIKLINDFEIERMISVDTNELRFICEFILSKIK